MNQKAVPLLRVSYWVGAVMDIGAGLIMTFPFLFSFFNQLTGFTPTPAFKAVAGMGAPLMFGWTVLLIWADCKPVERKAVLLITLIPIVGNLVNQVFNVTSGFVTLNSAIPQWIMQVLLIALFAYSYWFASRVNKNAIEH